MVQPRRAVTFALALCIAARSVFAQAPQAAPAPEQPSFTYQQVMVPMRDGIKLQTVILTPVAKSAPLPILLTRTPYGVPVLLVFTFMLMILSSIFHFLHLTHTPIFPCFHPPLKLCISGSPLIALQSIHPRPNF